MKDAHFPADLNRRFPCVDDVMAWLVLLGIAIWLFQLAGYPIGFFIPNPHLRPFVILALAFATVYLGQRIFTWYLYFVVTVKNPDEADYKKPLYKDTTPIPDEIREAVEARDGRKCAYHWHFGSLKTWHLDHSVPRDYDGENSPENLTVSCPQCNLSKSGLIEGKFADPILRRLWKRGKTIHRELVTMPKLWSW